MPANFTAVNSEVVYGGADLFSILADTTAPIWNAANVKTFNTNLVTIVGNKYVQGFLDNTVGAVFSGTWTPGDGLTGFGGQFSTIWKKNYTDNVTDESTGAQKFGYGALGVVNSILNVAGNLAAIYNLGFGTAKNIVGEGVYKA